MTKTPDELIAEQRITATLTIRNGLGQEVAIGAILDDNYEVDSKRLKLLAFAALAGALAGGIVKTPDALTHFDRARIDKALAEIAEGMSAISSKRYAA